MITSAFEGFLVPERLRRKAAREGGFAIPAMQERPMGVVDTPLLVTNARRSFVQAVPSREHVVRYGFSECPLEDESNLLGEFYRILWSTSETQGWVNRCKTIAQAKQILESFGLLPRTLLVPFATLHKVCGQEISLDEARKLTVSQGCVAEVDGLKVLFSDLCEGQLILGTSPPLVGVYTRIDDHVGLVFRKIDQSVVLINELAR
jgi:hypothetical protein